MKEKIAIGIVLTLVMASFATIPSAVAHTEEEPYVRTLYAGQNKPVGTVSVWNDEDSVHVEYEITESDWYITETHVHVGETLDVFPLTKKENPKVGNFEYTAQHDYVTSYTLTIPIDDLEGEVLIAAHAVVETICDYEYVFDVEEFELGLPEQVTISVSGNGNGGAYFPNTQIGGLDGVTEVYSWCVDVDRTIDQNTDYLSNVYSSLEVLPSDLMVYPENVDLINWILNQDYIGTESGCDGVYTYGDVQRSIWTLVDDKVSTGGLGPWSQCRVDEILADAYANGEGFNPGCGDIVGVVLDPVSGAQPLLAQVPVPCTAVPIYCGESETAWADGARFTNKGSWAMYFEYEIDIDMDDDNSDDETGDDDTDDDYDEVVEPVLYEDWQAGNAYFECEQAGGCGDFAWKIEGYENGEYDTNSNQFSNEPVLPSNNAIITISNSDGLTFDWSSDMPVCTVIVKGGPSANVYYYPDGSYGDTGLTAPVNPNTPRGKHYGISHITFCWKPITIIEWPEGGTTTIAFEDLSLGGSLDYDYNDWVADIETTATFWGITNDRDLISMEFTINPEARGAGYDHEFHMKFLADTFASDGEYTLTVFDEDGDPVSGYPMIGFFDVSIDNDFIVIPDTKQVLPGTLTNTIEPTGIVSHYPTIGNTDPNAQQHQEYVPTERTATLTIEFENREPFDFNAYDPYIGYHGEGLFFDPYLHVINTGDDIHASDYRMLTVPADWMWPEAGVGIWHAYPDVTSVNPPTFSADWWLNYNDLVYNGKP